MSKSVPGKKNPRILAIFVKNTSAVDYAIPLLWKIKQEKPETDISVLYFVMSRWQILRRDHFYSGVLKECGVKEYDLSSFLPRPYVYINSIARRLFSYSGRDKAKSRLEKSRLVGKFFKKVKSRVRKIEKYLNKRIDMMQIMPFFSPDYVLLDHRTRNLKALHPDGKFLHDYFRENQTNIFLLPHGPHQSSESGFVPYDVDDPLPEYCEFWIPFRFDRNWEGIPEKKNQFAHVGYPGFDSAWLNWLQKRQKRQHPFGKRPLRCFYPTRKFLKKGEPKPEIGQFTLTYEEFVESLDRIDRAIQQTGREIELIIKPHPNNDYNYLEEILKESSLSRWQISYESMYATFPNYDFIVSLYSTTVLIPMMAGTPVILVHSPWQDLVHEWEQRTELYTGLRYYVKNPEDLPSYLNRVIELLDSNEPGREDVSHLRKFWPDESYASCMKRMGLN